MKAGLPSCLRILLLGGGESSKPSPFSEVFWWKPCPDPDEDYIPKHRCLLLQAPWSEKPPPGQLKVSVEQIGDV
jgi:hypothetical protein